MMMILLLASLTSATVYAQSTDCDTVLRLWKDMGGSTSVKNGCSLPGVTSSFGSVTAINWSSQGLKGTISSDIESLKDLQYLILANNQLSGQIPKEIGNLVNLVELKLFNNNFSGSIPKEIGKLRKLQYIWLSTNRFSGSIPNEIGDLPDLFSLYLHNNQLSGEIPVKLCDLSNLNYLLLDENKLSGSIPKEIGKLKKLRSLFLSLNRLTGRIPDEIASLSNLQALSLASNRLTGSIPKAIGKMSSLVQLMLHTNSLSGSIPSEMGKLHNMTLLWLFDNQLTGDIPSEIGNLKALWHLVLADNKLTGVPSSFAKLQTRTIALFPNPVSSIPYDAFTKNTAAGLSPQNWTNIFSLSSLYKRSFSSSQAVEEAYSLCPLNDVKNANVAAGCITGIYNKFCRDTKDLQSCHSAYDNVVASSIFQPLRVCAAWRSGPNSMTCASAIQNFLVVTDYMTLTSRHAMEFKSSIFASKLYAPCVSTSSVTCNW